MAIGGRGVFTLRGRGWGVRLERTFWRAGNDTYLGLGGDIMGEFTS